MIRLPSAEDPAVSMIVLLDGAVEMAERCLQAIAAADDSIPCETVLLLNDPDPALEDLVRKSTTGGKVILSRANSGPGVGWNLGAAVAKAPRLATLHEDSQPDPGWLAPLCEAMTETNAGAVGSRLYNHDGSVQNCGWVLYSDASHQPINDLGAPEVVASADPTPADQLSGAAMLVDRDAVRAAGGWDERFHPAVFVDIDISTAMWNQGRPVFSVPASRVRHLSGTFDRRPNTPLTGPRLRFFLYERHRARFLAKWGPAVESLGPPPPDADPERVRAAIQGALVHTRERAERIRSGTWKPSVGKQSAERPYSGIPTPVLDAGDDTYEVAPEVEETLDATEAELVSDYCIWITRKEEEASSELGEVHGLLHQRQLELVDVYAQLDNLQRRHNEVSVNLDRILHGRTWRLRTMVVRILRPVRAAVARMTAVIRRRGRPE